MSEPGIQCGYCSENLLAELRGELSERDSERVRAHLDTCPDCRTDRGEMLRMRDLIAALPEIEPSGESWSRLVARIEGGGIPEGSPARLRFLWPALGLLAAAAIAFFLLFLPSPAPASVTILAGKVSSSKAGVLEAETAALLSLSAPRPATITLARGSRFLAPASGTPCRLLGGRALFEVEPGESGFEVATALGRIEVEGTTFDVDLGAGSLTLSVLRGVVTLRTGGKPVLVDSGMSVTVQRGGTPGAQVPVNRDDVLRWTRAPTPLLVLSEGLLRFTLENATVHPVDIKPFDPAVGVYSLRIEGPGGKEDVKLQSAMLRDPPASAPGGRSVSLKPGQGYRLSIDTARLRLSPGDYRISVVYTPYTNDLPEGAWRGVLISPPVRLRVD